MPIWNGVTRNNIFNAMNRIDFITLRNTHLENARGNHFFPAANLNMYFDFGLPTQRGPYEARPLVAWAYNDQNPAAPFLTPADFLDDDAHIFLQLHGFTPVNI